MTLVQRFANLTFVSSSDLDKPVVERELVGDATEQGNFKCCETLVVTNDWEEYVGQWGLVFQVL